MDFDNFISPTSRKKLKKREGFLESEPTDKEKIDIINEIPRFAPNQNYTLAFGRQWKEYSKVQLDSFNRTTISEERVEVALNCPLASLKGLKVLEAGSGAGRFTEILLKYGAIVYSFDLSEAVEVNLANNRGNKDFTIFQADIEKIPFRDNYFDIALCLGVMQHTRNSFLSLKELERVTKKDGTISFDHYQKHLGQYISLYLVYWIIIKNLNSSNQLKVTEFLTRIFFPIHWFFRNISFIQFLLRRISPISFYYGMFDLSKDQHMEVSMLDTHDKNTDHYKRMLSHRELEKLIKKFDFKSYKIFKGGTGLQCIITK
jgi:ubiquinone/menaquinone biosynthesis C-methylase UbiE